MSDINQPEQVKNITIFLPDQEIRTFYVGQFIRGVHGKTVKDIDAYLENSGVRITYSDSSYDLFSGSPFIFKHIEQSGCQHNWQEIDANHDLKSQFNEQCEKCKLLRLWKI